MYNCAIEFALKTISSMSWYTTFYRKQILQATLSHNPFPLELGHFYPRAFYSAFGVVFVIYSASAVIWNSFLCLFKYWYRLLNLHSQHINSYSINFRNTSAFRWGRTCVSLMLFVERRHPNKLVALVGFVACNSQTQANSY